jgi:hypothetical protein
MKALFTPILFLVTAVLQAQPQLQSTMLQTGKAFELYMVANPNMSNIVPGGANVSWSIAGTSTTMVGEVSLVNASATPHASAYPDANFALQFTIGTQVSYNIFKLSSSAFEELASGLGRSGSTIYTLSRNALEFPLDYGNTFSDDYQKQGQVVKTLNSKYDGYGTLQTSDSTYNNVVRVMQVNGDGDTSAIWWQVTATEMNPIMQADDDGIIFWKRKVTTALTEINNADQVSVYPNPFNQELTINLPNHQSYHLNLFDISGKLVQSVDGIGGDYTSLSNLHGGIYYYTIQTANAVYNGKLIKQ